MDIGLVGRMQSNSNGHSMTFNVKKIFERVTGLVFAVMLLFLSIGIIIGTIRLFALLYDLIVSKHIMSDYVHVISQVLALFILIELTRSLVEYFEVKRVRLTFIIDAAIVFVLRDVMIGLFETKLEVMTLYALSALLLVLGVLRIGSIVVHQRYLVLNRSYGKGEIIDEDDLS